MALLAITKSLTFQLISTVRCLHVGHINEVIFNRQDGLNGKAGWQVGLDSRIYWAAENAGWDTGWVGWLQGCVGYDGSLVARMGWI